MFKLIHNKKGISLVELIIAIVVLGLVISLSGMILNQLLREYQSGTERWQVQNAVRLACSKFENNANYIANSKQIDIFRDSALDAGIDYDTENHTWTWREEPTLIGPDSDDYTYLYSVKAYEAGTDNELGYFLFMKYDTKVMGTIDPVNAGKESEEDYSSCMLFLDNEGFGESPVKVQFSIGTNYILPETTTEAESTTKSEETTESTTVPSATGAPVAYMNNSVHIWFSSGDGEKATYATDTRYVSENLAGTKSVGMEKGELIYNADGDWDTTDENGGTGHKVYPCGWVAGKVSGYPSESAMASDGYTDDEISSYGNVLRFLSPLSDKTVDDASGSSTTNLPNCLDEWTFNGTINADFYLDKFRNFRDNVLKGTEFGDWFINQYYNEWSPFLIENTAFLKPVYKGVLTHLAYVCDMMANASK